MIKKILIFTLCIFTIIPISVYAEDIYDVVLFWGQSNMRGASVTGTCEGKVDENLGKTDASRTAFSTKTGIHPFIVSNYKSVDFVSVPFNKNTAFEYRWFDSEHLKVLTSDTKNVGETTYVKNNSGRLSYSGKGSGGRTFMESLGTNVSLWFSKTYYERTGHKVVVVMAARNLIE